MSAAFAEIGEAVRAVMARLVEPGAAVSAGRLAQELGLSRTLTWRLMKIAELGSLPSAEHMPGTGGFELFVRAAAERGVDASVVERVRRAHTHFRLLVHQEAGDRASLGILAGNSAEHGDSALELRLRRESFRCQAYTLGVQAELNYRGYVAFRGTDATMDIVFLTGYQGLRRVRERTRWLLNVRRITNRFLDRESGASYEPLADALRGQDVRTTAPVVPWWASTPPAAVRRVSRGPSLEDELQPGPAGLSAATDLMLGEVLRGIPDDEDAEVVLYPWVMLPCERGCWELLLHESLHDGRMPLVRFYSRVHDEPSFRFGDDRDLLQLNEHVQHVGSAARFDAAVGLRDHQRLIRWTIEQMGLDARSVQVYRLEMRFPPMPLTVWLEFRRRS